MAGNLIEKSLHGDTADQPQGNCCNAKSLLEEIPHGEEVATISPTGVALGWRAAFYGCGVARVNQSEPEVVGSNPPTVDEVAAVLAFTDRNQRIIAIPKPLFLDKGGCGVWTSIRCTIVFFLRGNIWVKSGYSS